MDLENNISDTIIILRWRGLPYAMQQHLKVDHMLYLVREVHAPSQEKIPPLWSYEYYVIILFVSTFFCGLKYKYISLTYRSCESSRTKVINACYWEDRLKLYNYQKQLYLCVLKSNSHWTIEIAYVVHFLFISWNNLLACLFRSRQAKLHDIVYTRIRLSIDSYAMAIQVNIDKLTHWSSGLLVRPLTSKVKSDIPPTIQNSICTFFSYSWDFWLLWSSNSSVSVTYRVSESAGMIIHRSFSCFEVHNVWFFGVVLQASTYQFQLYPWSLRTP